MIHHCDRVPRHVSAEAAGSAVPTSSRALTETERNIISKESVNVENDGEEIAPTQQNFRGLACGSARG